jgi:hypothetical protein
MAFHAGLRLDAHWLEQQERWGPLERWVQALEALCLQHLLDWIGGGPYAFCQSNLGRGEI